MTDLRADLDDFEGLTEGNDFERACDPPEDMETANRLGRWLCSIARKRAEVQRLYQAEVDRLDRWAEERDRPLKVRYDWLERGLEGWARAVNAEHCHEKTWDLPSGVHITIRTPQPKVIATTDQDILDTLAHLAPGCVRTRLEADKRAVAKVAQDGGVVATTDDEEHRQLVLRRTDPDTGEVRETVLPGILRAVPLTDRVTVKPTGVET